MDKDLKKLEKLPAWQNDESKEENRGHLGSGDGVEGGVREAGAVPLGLKDAETQALAQPLPKAVARRTRMRSKTLSVAQHHLESAPGPS